MRMKRRLYFPVLIALLVALVSGVLPLGQPAIVYAAPDIESIWSESNSVSDPDQLTLTSSTSADGSETGTWADANGDWAKTPVESWTFVMADSTLVSKGAITSVSLYLKHYQSGWSDDNFLIQIYDGSAWNDVQSYSTSIPPPTSDTNIDNWDVKALGIDTWTEINAAQVRIIGNGPTKGEDTVDWFVDTVELRIEYTPPDISNTPTIFGFGTLSEGATVETTGGLTTAYFTVTNNSAFAVNITIGGTDMTGGTAWTLSDTATPGVDTYGLKAGLEEGSYNIIVKKTGPYNTLVSGLSNVAPNNTQSWGLQLLAPITFTGGGANSGTVTLTATQP